VAKEEYQKFTYVSGNASTTYIIFVWAYFSDAACTTQTGTFGGISGAPLPSSSYSVGNTFPVVSATGGWINSFIGSTCSGQSGFAVWTNTKVDTSSTGCQMVPGSATSTTAAYYATIDCTPSGGTSCINPSSSTTSTCFAGSESIQLDSGSTKLLSDVQIGDRVMVSKSNGMTSFSEVIMIPHQKNNVQAMFTHISTKNGRDIQLTPNHLILSGTCNDATAFSLIAADQVKVGNCLVTIDGTDEIISTEKVLGTGVYTIVTMSKDLLVVNGIVASPFAMNHIVATSFYDIHRMLYAMMPALFAHSWIQKATEFFGSIVTSF